MGNKHMTISAAMWAKAKLPTPDELSDKTPLTQTRFRQLSSEGLGQWLNRGRKHFVIMESNHGQ